MKSESKGLGVMTNRIMMTMIALITLLIGLQLSGAAAQSFEPNVDRPGMDYRSFELANPNPLLCQQQCFNEPVCRAWTYVRPGVQGPRARCWLKERVPEPTPSDCCISGTSG